MKSLNLWFFSVFFSFCAFSAHFDNSIEARHKRKKIALQEDAESLMNLLEMGDVDAYREKKDNINYRDIKKIFQHVNDNGDNILHFLVRLERFEDLNQKYNLGDLLIEEAQYVFDVLPAWKFIQFLTQGNNQEVSPLREAASSKYLSEYLDERRTVLSNHLSENVLSKIFSTPIPFQNRGLAYKALRRAVRSYSWPWRTAFDAMFSVVIPAGTGAIAYGFGDSVTLGVGAGAVAVGACAVIFKRLSNLKKAEKLLSGRGGVEL